MQECGACGRRIGVAGRECVSCRPSQAQIDDGPAVVAAVLDGARGIGTHPDHVADELPERREITTDSDPSARASRAGESSPDQAMNWTQSSGVTSQAGPRAARARAWRTWAPQERTSSTGDGAEDALDSGRVATTRTTEANAADAQLAPDARGHRRAPATAAVDVARPDSAAHHAGEPDGIVRGPATPREAGSEPARPVTASDHADAPAWRATFAQYGWTAMAQLGLAGTGVLALLLAAVLVTIERHLRRIDADGPEAMQILFAQDRVGSVLLPALLVISVVALVGAIMRALIDHRTASDGTPRAAGVSIAGLPIALWTVTIPNGALLTLVVTWTAPETVAAAQFANRQLLVIVVLLALTSLLGAAGLRPVGSRRADAAVRDSIDAVREAKDNAMSLGVR